MIKAFTLLFLASALNFCFAKELEPFKPYFEVLSIKKDKKVSRNKCLIEGQFYDYRSGEKIGDITVERGQEHILLPDGSFAILMKLSKPSLKMHKPGFNALVFDKFELKGGCRMKLRFYLENELIDDEEPRFEVKKPVIYAYSEKDLDFEMKIKSRGNLSFVYPPLKEGTWSVQIKDNKVYDKNSALEYPYLFWEGVQYSVEYRTLAGEASRSGSMNYELCPGTLVSKENILPFLDTSLTAMGFNEKEKTDFITFWAPQLRKNKYCFVQFRFDEECEDFAAYEISPKPDQVNRVYMLFSGYNEQPHLQVIPQKLQKMKREGFYLVDWGGVEIPGMENRNDDNRFHNE